MREYLYELTHSDELVTSVLPIGDGITVKCEEIGKEGYKRNEKTGTLIPASSLEVLKQLLFTAQMQYILVARHWTACESKIFYGRNERGN